jgi:hypothetical protein
MAKTKNAVFFVLMLAFALALLEGLFFLTGKLLQSRWAMWRPPSDPHGLRGRVSFADYLKGRDPVLGWPSLQQYGRELDVNGALPNSRFKDAARYGSCISLYGDSFTGRIRPWLRSTPSARFHSLTPAPISFRLCRSEARSRKNISSPPITTTTKATPSSRASSTGAYAKRTRRPHCSHPQSPPALLTAPGRFCRLASAT